MKRFEESLREEYLDTMKRFEEGDKSVSVVNVLYIIFKYSISKPREYFQTFISERLRRR